MGKVRQLDYLLIKAKKEKADYLLASCGIQSNWSRQTAAAAIKMGMKALLVLRTARFKRPPKQFDGNMLLVTSWEQKLRSLYNCGNSARDVSARRGYNRRFTIWQMGDMDASLSRYFTETRESSWENSSS